MKSTLVLSVKMLRNFPFSPMLQNQTMVFVLLPHFLKLKPVSPLSETTEFLTDQVRSLISLLRVLKSLPADAKQGSADELRKLYLERIIAKRMADTRILGDISDHKRLEKIASLQDIRKLEGKS